jgi:phosphoserine phosphatase
VNDRITGKISGVPCYQDGKVKKLSDWLGENRASTKNLRMESATFYTDSINDLALMEVVAEPVAVDPDSSLEQVATTKQWQIISLR